MIRIQTYDGDLLHQYEDTRILPRRGDYVDLNRWQFKVDKVVFRSNMDQGESIIDIYVIPPTDDDSIVPRRDDEPTPLNKPRYLLDFGNHSDWYLFPIEKEPDFLRWVDGNNKRFPDAPFDWMIPVTSSEKVVITSYDIRD